MEKKEILSLRIIFLLQGWAHRGDSAVLGQGLQQANVLKWNYALSSTMYLLKTQNLIKTQLKYILVFTISSKTKSRQRKKYFIKPVNKCIPANNMFLWRAYPAGYVGSPSPSCPTLPVCSLSAWPKLFRRKTHIISSLLRVPILNRLQQQNTFSSPGTSRWGWGRSYCFCLFLFFL